MADQKKKQLAYNIVEFLKTSAQDGTIKDDDKESLEVAISCISEAFGIDTESDADKHFSLAPATLLSLLDVYLKTKAKSGPTPTPSSTSSTSAKATTSGEPSAADKAKADSLKAAGNAQMSSKQYDAAIASYTSAIALNPDPVYYSNRAAAWGAQGNHAKAAEDAQRAIDIDPSFVKGYSRLGHARFSLGEYSEAVKAYEDGLRAEPGNANMKQSLATAKAKLAEQGGGEADVSGREAGADRGADAGGMPDLSALAGMMGGMGGGGRGGGGMPDLASLMNNPQMMQMAQQMMGNGGLERLMANPSIRRMAEQYQSGGGMPDMSQLANDPEMRNLAQSFMGGAGGTGSGR